MVACALFLLVAGGLLRADSWSGVAASPVQAVHRAAVVPIAVDPAALHMAETFGGAEAGSANLRASLNYDTVAASGFASSGTVTFTIRDAPGGTVLASGSKTADGAGDAWFSRPSDHSVDFVPGMQITAGDGTTTKQVTLAAITITSVNRVTDVVAGTAPGGAEVQVDVGNETDGTSLWTTAGGGGGWSIDFAPFDITLTTWANANVADGDGDITVFEKPAASIIASLTDDNIAANGFASNGSVSFTIRQSPGGAVLASATKAADVVGNASFNRGPDHGVDLLPGMQITVGDGTITKGLTTAALAINVVNPATEIVAGTAPADEHVYVDVNDSSGWGGKDVVADAGGDWAADFTGLFNVTFATGAMSRVIDSDGDTTRADKQAPRIDGGLSTDNVSASGFGANGNVSFTIRQAPGGTVLASGSKTADAGGNAWFNRGPDHGVDLAPGMQITVGDGTFTKGLTLVALAINLVDPATDVVAGTAPADAQVQVNVSWANKQVTADADGNWSADFTGLFDITYTTGVSATIADADADTTSAQHGVATFEASLNADQVSANGFASNGSVSFTIRQSPGGTVLASGSKTADANGNVQFNRLQDHDVDLVPGMQVAVGDGTVTKELTLVALAITSVNPATDDVTGTAPAGTPLDVNVNDNVGGGASMHVTADGSGHWTADFTGLFDVTSATGANAWVHDADGDATTVNKPGAVMNAQLTEDNVWANSFAANASVSFTIRQSPGGTVLASGSKATDANGSASFNRPQDHNVDLVPGMQVTVSDGTLTKDVTLAALAIASVDPVADDVTGTAPAGAQVQVDVNGPIGGATKRVTADGSGHWTADFTGLFDITGATGIGTWVFDPDGDGTGFSRAPAVFHAYLTHDNLWANGFARNASVNFTIRQSPGGTVLASGSKATDAGGNASINRPQDHNVDLIPGMQVVISDGAVTKDMTLLTVAVTLVDPATDDVTGTAPANAQVQVNLQGPAGPANKNVTAGGDGHWSADFSGVYDVTYETTGQAQVRDDDGDSTDADRGVATITAGLTGDGVSANGFAANGSVSFTIRQSPGGAVLASGSKPADGFGNAQFNRNQDHNIDLLPGMQVVATDGAVTKDLTLVAVAITSVNPATDIVSGTAPAGAQLDVHANDPSGGASRQATADGSGHWTADFTGVFDITYTNGVNASVRDADGDMTSAFRMPATLDVALTYDNVSANGLAANANVSLTIRQSPGGAVLASVSRFADSNGNVQFNRYQDYEVDLLPGMQVVVGDGTITKDLTLAAVAVTLVDPAADDVTGTAPISAQVQVNLQGPSGPASKQAAADGSGDWSADFTGLYDVTYTTWATASVRDTDGDATNYTKAAATVGAALTEDAVNATGFASNGTVTFTIRQSPGGAVLASGTKPTNAEGSAQFMRWDDYDVDLIPGMQVTVGDGTTTKVLTLAALAITSVDPATDVVTGTSAPNEQVDVNVNNPGWWNQRVTADGSGHWTADFGGVFDITYTTYTNASVHDGDGDTTSSSRMPATFNASLTFDIVAANGFAPNASVTFTIRESPGGGVLASGTKSTDGGGNAEFNRYDDHEVDLIPGMEVTVGDGTTTKSLILPAIAVTSVDPVTDAVAGTAPPDAQVMVNVNGPGGGNGTQVTADGAGQWSADFSGLFDITYETWARVGIQDADGDTAVAGHGVPTVNASLTWDGISANGFAANGDVSFTIRESPGGAVLATGSRTSDASGYAEFNRWDDYDVDLVPGMQITVSDASVTKELTLGALAIDSVDPETDTVAGSAPAGAHVQVDVGDDNGGASQETTANGAGDWSIDFSGSYDITYASYASARVADVDGDTTQADRGATTINASLSSDGIWGNWFAGNADISFTIRQSPGGAVLATGSKTSDASGSVEINRWEDFDVDLAPGMQITVSDGTLTKQLTLVALAIDSVNPATDTVAGSAPAGADVQVDVGDDNGGASQATTANGAGHWTIDFSGNYDITYASGANARISDGDGDATSFDKSPPCISGDVTYDNIWGDGFAGDTGIGFTIRQSPGGAVLATGSKTSDANGHVDLNRFDDYDVDLAPGMQITMGDGTLTKQLTLAALVIDSVNPGTEVVAGTAPAGADVQVDLGDESGWASQNVTAGGNGEWSADFTDMFDITYATSAGAAVRDADEDATYAGKQPPSIGANVTVDSIWANGFLSNASVTFTIRQSPGGTVLATGSKTSDASGSVDFSRDADFSVDLVPGMQVTVADGAVSKQLSMVVLGVTSVNAATNVVAGTAPAGALVQVGVWGESDGTGQETTAAGDGTWSIDFSPFDITSAMQAGASVADDDGDTVSASWVADLRFGVADYTVSEGAGTVEITVQRIGGAPAEVDVSYATSNGTATAGSDYTATSGTLTFPDGVTSRTFTVSITDDTTHESDETVSLALSDPRGGGVLASPFTATITILDNDADDTTPPVTTIDSGPSGETDDPTPTFTFSANETATFECRVDAAAFAACTSPYTTATLSDGAHTFYARATDAAGNQGAAVSRTFAVEWVVPGGLWVAGEGATPGTSLRIMALSPLGHGVHGQYLVAGAETHQVRVECMADFGDYVLLGGHVIWSSDPSVSGSTGMIAVRDQPGGDSVQIMFSITGLDTCPSDHVGPTWLPLSAGDFTVAYAEQTG